MLLLIGEYTPSKLQPWTCSPVLTLYFRGGVELLIHVGCAQMLPKQTSKNTINQMCLQRVRTSLVDFIIFSKKSAEIPSELVGPFVLKHTSLIAPCSRSSLSSPWPSWARAPLRTPIRHATAMWSSTASIGASRILTPWSRPDWHLSVHLSVNVDRRTLSFRSLQLHQHVEGLPVLRQQSRGALSGQMLVLYV
jgi:hypothetical protein